MANSRVRVCETQSILGISERNLVLLSAADRAKFVKTDVDGVACFENVMTKELFPYGEFETVTIAELRKRVEALPAVCQASIPRATPKLETRSGVDIGELQARLSSEHAAMVQVASNFNCLENASRRMPPDCGRLVDHASQDCTQGPAAVFGTLPSYIYRAHFVNGGAGQTITNSINLLSGAPDYCGISENGKFSLLGTEKVIENTDAAISAAADRVAVGLHVNCPVVFGRTKERGIFSHAPQDTLQSRVPQYPLVDHVLSASVNYNDYHGVARFASPEAQSTATQSLLRAAYQGLYLSAILRKRKELYMTLVGGGVFGNPKEMIMQELERAHDEWASHPASCLERCVLALYSSQDEREVKRYLKGESLTEQEMEARRILAEAESAETQGEIGKAIRLYNQAYKLDPSLDA